MSEPLTYDVLAALIGEHAPVYDYRQGNFTMECEACDFVLGGVDRDEAKARFGGHFAAHVAEQLQPLIRQAQAEAWGAGYRSGHSNAMRRMSDEPSAPTSRNPYLAGGA